MQRNVIGSGPLHQGAQASDDRFLELLFTPDYEQELMQVEGLAGLEAPDLDPFSLAPSPPLVAQPQQPQQQQHKRAFESIYAEWRDGSAPSPGIAVFDDLPTPAALQHQGTFSSTQDLAADASYSSEVCTLSNCGSKSGPLSFRRGSSEGPSLASSDKVTITTTALTGTTANTSNTSNSGTLDTCLSGSTCTLTGVGSGGSSSLAASALTASTFMVQPALARTSFMQGQGSTTQAGWQALLQKVQEAEAPVPPPPQPGPRRGRKPTHMVNGVAITKPVKDKKRENSILIKQLEAQLAEKLTLVKGLEGENSDLKRKERLLQMSVDTSEHNLSHLSDPDSLDRNLEPMLKSFRSTYNRAHAERVLSAYTKGKGITFDMFVTCWQVIVMEMCDALVADASASTPEVKAEVATHLQQLHTQLVDFIMAVCATDLSIIRQAKSRNLCTGEEAESYEFWETVIEKLALTQEQLLDLLGAFDMFSRLFQRNLDERGQLKKAVDEAIAGDASIPFGTSDAMLLEAKVRLQEASDKLTRNVRQCGVLHSMLSFMTMKILNPKQTAQLCMHSAPYFPSIVHMQVVIRRTAESLGILKPTVMSQQLLVSRFGHPHGGPRADPPPLIPSLGEPRMAPQAVCT